MENQTEVTTAQSSRKPKLTPEEKARARKVQEARQKLRMCSAAEFVCARLGTDATVADILKQAGMSRRSFYEYFDSLADMIEQMHRATSGPVKCGPHVSWLALAANPGRDIGMSPEHAFERSRMAAASDNGFTYLLTDDEVIAWAASTIEVAK